MKQLILLLMYFLVGSMSLLAQEAKHPIVIHNDEDAGSNSIAITPRPKERLIIGGDFGHKIVTNKVQLESIVQDIKNKYLTEQQRKKINSLSPSDFNIYLCIDKSGKIVSVTFFIEDKSILNNFTHDQLQKLYDAFWEIKYPIKKFIEYPREEYVKKWRKYILADKTFSFVKPKQVKYED